MIRGEMRDIAAHIIYQCSLMERHDGRDGWLVLTDFKGPSVEEQEPRVIPLSREELSVTTRKIETGRVRVSTRMLEHTGLARADLHQDDVKVEHVPIGREIDAAPPIREEGDTIIIPIVQEIMVVETRLVLREEVRITRSRSVETFEQPVQLRTMVAEVERDEPPLGG
jgi:uncharacterized protein (TIGR02271 family)